MAKDDFFEEAPRKKEVKAKKGGKNEVEESQTASAGIAYTVNLYLAVGLVVTAFVVGFFIRGVVMPSTETAVPTQSTPTQAPTQAPAPPLTQEQIEQGSMPEDHVPVTEETTTSSETDTTSSETSTPSSEAP